MKFTDIIALAKAGYGPDDVKELLKVETPTEEPLDSQVEETIKADPIKEEEKEEVIETPQPEVDYKALYEESQKKLQEVQTLNTRQNMAGAEENTEDALLSAISRFL